MSLEENTLLHERYRILEKMGSGGMAIVYRGYDESLGVDVAIKENLFVSPEAGRQFEREARLLATLRHPGLPRVTDHFVIEDQGQYLVMDFVPGEDAYTRMKQAGGALPETEVLTWAGEILDALGYMHTRPHPVIHRDIKPGNIKITPAGHAVLVDFGLAKEQDPEKTTTMGARALTPGFAPPEQYGHGRTDTRTDVFSAAATFYALLTGHIPADSIKREMGLEPLVPMRELNPAIRPEVANAIERALNTNPDLRFQSIKEFRRALIPAGQPVPPPAAPTVAHAVVQPTVRADALPAVEAGQPADRHPRKRMLPIVIGGIFLVAAVIGIGMILPKVLGGDRPTVSTPLTTMEAAFPVETTTGTVLEEPTTAPASETIVTLEPTSEATSGLPTIGTTPEPDGMLVGGGSGQIAFASMRAGKPQIFVMGVDGSSQEQHTTMPDGACQPEFSPDGKQLLFISPCRGKEATYPNSVIYIMNVDGSDVRPFITKVGGVFDPEWSQAGVLFTYLEGKRPGVWWANAVGGDQRQVSGSNAYDRQPSWSPDGSKLVLLNTSRSASPVLFWFYEDGSFDGSTPDQVTRDQLAGAPAWSPAGDLISYAASNHIWVIPWDALGFGEIRLTDLGPNDDPEWSPDGQWIVFETWRDNANHDIYIMLANGGGQTRLTNDPALDFQPVWRP